MPAPAVIPALIAYVKVVAVKTLVVGVRLSEARDWVCSGCASGRASRPGRRRTIAKRAHSRTWLARVTGLCQASARLSLGGGCLLL